MANTLESFHFLIVEDDDVDILMLKRILVDLDKDIAFSIAHDGVEALELLRDETEDGLANETVIILLDINMPRMGGHEFLENLRADEKLNETIVFVLSTSTDSRDINKSYGRNIAGYIPKDRLNRDEFKTLMEAFLNMNMFPGSGGGEG